MLMFENQDIKKLFSKKPIKQNISGVQLLESFVENYPDESLKPNLQKLLADRQYYRAVNGDGNCFYRAAIFLFLKWADLSNYRTLFLPADLFKCKNLPFKVSQHLTSQNLLYYLWQTELQPLTDLSPQNREKNLQEMINRSLAVDAILIAYCRVLNYNYLIVNKRQYQPYTPGGFQIELNRVLTFGTESQGIQLFSLSKILNLQIVIMMVHQQNLTQVDYNHTRESKKIQLFYRPGHYDILCEKQQQLIQSKEKSQKLSFTQFYNKNKSLNNSPASHLNKNNHQSASRIISISQPSEILRLLSHRNMFDSNLKAPQNIKQFMQNLREQNSKLAKSYSLESPSVKINSRKAEENNVKNKAIEIKCTNVNRKDQMMQQIMLKQGILCVFGLILLTMGILSI